MKRKGDQGGGRGESPYFGDRQLLYRIRQYLRSTRKGLPGSRVVINVMADDLQQEYGEYARKKKKAFQKLVEKAYHIVRAEENGGRGSAAAATEDGFPKSAKRKKTSHMSDSSSDSSFSSETEELQKKPPNLLNQMVCDMYRRSGSTGSLSSKPTAVTKPEIQPCDWCIDTDIPHSACPDPAPCSAQGGTASSSSLSGILRSQASTVATATTPVSRVESGQRQDTSSLTPSNGGDSKQTCLTQAVEGEAEDNDTEAGRRRGVEAESPPEMEVEREPLTDTRRPRPAPLSSSEVKEASEQKRAKRKSLKRAIARTIKEDNPIPIPTQTLKDFAGIERLEEIHKLVTLKFMRWEKFERAPESCARVVELTAMGCTRGLLLSGPAGCGKTHLVRCMAGELNVHLLEVPAETLIAGISGESEENINAIIFRAIANQPCIVLLERLEAITSRYGSNTTAMTDRIICALQTSISAIPDDAKVLVIGSTRYPEKIAPDLRGRSCFRKEIEMNIPDEHTREEILKVALTKHPLAEDVDVSTLARATPGFTGSDLCQLRDDAYSTALEKFVLLPTTDKTSSLKPNYGLTEDDFKDLCLKTQDFEAAMKTVQPSTKAGFPLVPAESWDQIGGLHAVMKEIRNSVLRPVFFPQKFTKSNILLIGPPGCGKTLIAKALANEANINFLTINGPELLNKYVGASEENLRTAFRRARNAAPCILFFDEIDSLSTKRDQTTGGSNNGIAGTFLTELDGVEQKNSKVVLLAATNRPDALDPALMRQGRIHRKIFIGLPDEAARLDILKRVLKKISSARNVTVNLAEDVDLEDIARQCGNFSGADINGMVDEAVTLAMDLLLGEDIVDFHKKDLDFSSVTVCKDQFEEALSRVESSLSESDVKMYADMEKKYGLRKQRLRDSH